MNRERAILLKSEAERVERIYSGERSKNWKHERFKLVSICPLSDDSAAVLYVKDSGKLALSHWYYIRSLDRWMHYFPTDAHFLGMAQILQIKRKVELHNFPLNKEVI